MPIRLQVLHISEVLKGGVGTYLRELLALQRETYGPGMVGALVPSSQVSELQAAPDMQLATFSYARSRLASVVRLAVETRKLVRRWDPRIIHIHSTYAGALIRPLLAVTRHRATVIYCPHGWAFQRESSSLVIGGIKALEALWSRWCDAIICVSNHEREVALRIGIPAERLKLVRNGLPAQGPSPCVEVVDWPRDALRVLFVGRFDQQKGIDILFGALRELGDRVFAVVAGDSLRSTRGVFPDNARYAGWLSPERLESHYRSADVVVMPSRWEGFGLVAVEAMRAGLPVIASDVGGLPEIVEHGRTGMLITPDEKSLVEVLRSVERPRLRSMGDAGRSRFLQHFTIDSSYRELCAVYDQYQSDLEEAEFSREASLS
jgi:glycosyltransferase involved in cell wall biosynthesis